MQENLKHLQADQIVKSVFKTQNFASFCMGRSLRSHLVRSKLYPLQRATGSYKYNTPRSQVGKNVSHVTKETFK